MSEQSDAMAELRALRQAIDTRLNDVASDVPAALLETRRQAGEALTEAMAARDDRIARLQDEIALLQEALEEKNRYIKRLVDVRMAIVSIVERIFGPRHRART